MNPTFITQQLCQEVILKVSSPFSYSQTIPSILFNEILPFIFSRQHYKNDQIRSITGLKSSSGWLYDKYKNSIASPMDHRIYLLKDDHIIKSKRMSDTQKPTNSQAITASENDAIPFHRMFRFADRQDFLLIIFGMICSLASGACTPISFYLLIRFDTTFLIKDGTQMISSAYQNMMHMVYLGFAAFLTNWLATTIWIITGERQSSKCKKSYYTSLLSQDAQFFDCNEHSFINSKFTIDTDHFQMALGEKIGFCIQFLGNFLCGAAICLWQGWLLSLFMLIAITLVLLAAMASTTSLKNKQSIFLQLYSKAGSRAEQSISSIKTVKQFSAQSFQENLFGNLLEESSEAKMYLIIKIAISYGLLNSIIYIIYCFGFWFGGNCLAGTNICLTNLTGVSYINENVHTITCTLLLCLVEFTLLTPALKQIAFGKEAAQRIFKVIDHVPKIQVNNKGIRLEKLEGRVQFRNVSFAYPKDKNKKILDRLSLVFDLHSSALVGQSGCGKSTIIQLLMRLYDPDEGEVLIDGHNIRQLDILWLRSRIGYVGQEPVLFAATIRENLLYANPEATEEQMVDALRQAEVHDFVFKQLEKGLETQVGAGGSQISGGQKQRIAIARALVKQPQLLILDEATSALDRINELSIQKTLNKIAERLTTITIAHRISTIKESRTVFVIKKGKIEEQGNFEQLKYFEGKEYFKGEQQNPRNKAVNDPEEKQSPQSIDSSQALVMEDIQANNPLYPPIKKQENAIQKNADLLTKYEHSMFCRIFSFNRTKKLMYACSILAAIGIGLIYPIFAIFVSQVFLSVLYFKKDQSTLDDIYFGCEKFLYVALVSFVLYIIQGFCGENVGYQVASNLRMQVYGKIIKMPIPWFNKKENSCGVLSSRLSVECEKIKDLITTYIYIIVRCISTIISGVVIMFIYQWKLSLVVLGFVAVLVLSSIAKSHFKTRLTQQIDLVAKKTSGVIEESLMNIRTVASFNMQTQLINKYEQDLKGPSQSLIKIGVVTGFMNGLGYVIVVMVFGILVYVSLLMHVYDGASFQDSITTIFEFYFMALALSRNLNFMPDAEGTKISIANIFSILDTEDQEQKQEREGSKRLTDGFKGDIEFRDVSFRYEDRQESILSNLNLIIKEGEKTALVGASGCGKSTLVQLLLRFYEPTEGNIFVGGTELRDFDLAYLRRQFGVVAQQPVVFNGSFRDNIRYNTPANEQQIRDAAIQANAMAFIEQTEEMQKQCRKENMEMKEENPQEMVQKQGHNVNKAESQVQIVSEQARQGLDRQVGVRGFHISGGQKQRVAIARVLLRKPKILLLDEATSALDANNEREVQLALDKAMSGRTTVTIAHRIETIKNSSTIHVFAKGKVDESGTFKNLLKRKSTFYDMANGTKC